MKGGAGGRCFWGCYSTQDSKDPRAALGNSGWVSGREKERQPQLEAGGAARQEGHEGPEKALTVLHPEGLVRALGRAGGGEHRTTRRQAGGSLTSCGSCGPWRAARLPAPAAEVVVRAGPGCALRGPCALPAPYLALVLLLDHLLLRRLLIRLDCGERAQGMSR